MQFAAWTTLCVCARWNDETSQRAQTHRWQGIVVRLCEMVKCCLHFYDCNAATREVQIHHHFECALFVCLNADSSHSFVSHYTDDWYMCALHAIEVGKWSYAQLRRQMGRRRRNSVPSAIWWIQTMYEAATMVTMPQHCLVYTFFSLSMGRFPCVSTVDADTMLTRRANGWCTASKSKLVFVRYVNEFVGELDACGDPSIPTTNRFLQNFNYFPLLWSPPPVPRSILHFQLVLIMRAMTMRLSSTKESQ